MVCLRYTILRPRAVSDPINFRVVAIVEPVPVSVSLRNCRTTRIAVVVLVKCMLDFCTSRVAVVGERKVTVSCLNCYMIRCGIVILLVRGACCTMILESNRWIRWLLE